ncbi:hypothetical protein FHL15_007711 [Xylaria flabelliformis]|uniref:Zn(2)-C6 fungal-type domain-containing protein n=1 Tax=Xylaria flabelliformis TaxID=2512241 RepID=A0A553HU83_9PEZI|nr:hypothetical protein FHL15_007711 [Xylaria flabelliformis]
MPTQRAGAQRIRTTCDSCYKAKMKCSRGNPCETCARLGHKCFYSPSNRLGRPPKGQAKKGKVSTAVDATAQSSQLPDESTMATGAPRDDTKSEDSLTLDDMFMDVFLEPLPSGQATPHVGEFGVNQAAKASLLMLTEREQFSLSANGEDVPHPGRERCHCLQRHSQFLCNLKLLDYDHHSVTLDVARSFLSLWQNHLRCISCWDDEDKGALMLSMTNLTVVIKRLRRFINSLKLQESSQGCSLDDSVMVPNTPTLDIAGWGISAEASGTARRDSIAFSMDAMSSSNLAGLRIPEEEERAVASMLIMRILSRIRKGLSELRQRLHRTQGTQVCLLFDTFPTMIQSLDNVVENLEQSLRDLL